jgi:hypothetical protein
MSKHFISQLPVFMKFEMRIIIIIMIRMIFNSHWMLKRKYNQISQAFDDFGLKTMLIIQGSASWCIIVQTTQEVEINRAISTDLTGRSRCNRCQIIELWPLDPAEQGPGMPLASPNRDAFQSLAS